MFRHLGGFAGLILCTMAVLMAGDTSGAPGQTSQAPTDAAKPVAQAIPQTARQFITASCTRCHNPERNKGRLDLTNLAYDPEDRGNFALWVKVHDRVSAGEMPPEDAKQPDPANRRAFVASLAQTFIASERRQMAGEGRAIQRRMNRFEYENALRDLLGVP